MIILQVLKIWFTFNLQIIKSAPEAVRFSVNGEGKLPNTSYNDEDLGVTDSVNTDGYYCLVNFTYTLKLKFAWFFMLFRDKMYNCKDDDVVIFLKQSILQIMDGIVLNLPDACLENIIGRTLRLDILLILANTPSLDIRTAIVKVYLR